MKLDRKFAYEIKKEANGDGSRDARLAFIQKVRGASKMMSSPNVLYGKYYEAFRIYGRIPVAICIAATLYQRRERLDYWNFAWATEILDLWTNRTPHGIEDACINDGIHPTRICEYAGDFIKLTTGE